MTWRRRDPSHDYDAAHEQICRERMERERTHQLPEREPEPEEVDMSKVISSFCAADKPQCVEVEAQERGAITHVVVTDSKSGLDQALRFTLAEWDAFIAGVKAGEFDLLRLLEASGAPLIGTFAADLTDA